MLFLLFALLCLLFFFCCCNSVVWFCFVCLFFDIVLLLCFVSARFVFACLHKKCLH